MKASLSTATLGLAISLLCAYGPSRLVSSPLRVAATDRRTARQETSKHANGQRKSTAITLTVHVLPTAYGSGSSEVCANEGKFPKSVSVEGAAGLSGRISAYGAACRVWIAPRGWTGSAVVGGDGSTEVSLYPPNGSAKSGPRFRYENNGACAGCGIAGAAPYFACAMQEFKKFGFGTASPGTVPPGLKLTSVSASVVTYTLPDEGRLIVRGVAHYKCGSDEPFFQKAEFVLPRSDVRLLHFLMHTFIRREKLK